MEESEPRCTREPMAPSDQTEELKKRIEKLQAEIARLEQAIYNCSGSCGSALSDEAHDRWCALLLGAE